MMGFSYGVCILYALGAEFLRRAYLALYRAYLGPLTKVPGPSWWKFSSWSWRLIQAKEIQMNISPELLNKYGDVVRLAPNMVIVAGKDTIYKIVVDDDLKKGPAYDMMNVVDGVKTLFTERDKTLYRQKIRNLFIPRHTQACLC
ncbi:p450 monooxygenase [Phlyctema vagabunda]|uniref:P450 monooxygenase n=1 Tax=Phlyctema vagabunda TaxID=108571 RepID=A0ABR4P961_9HELO